MTDSHASAVPWSHATTFLLETQRRDGSWVGTPVSVVVADGHAFFRTYDASGKAKRLRNYPDVRIAPCSFLRGKPKGPGVAATARLLDSDEAQQARTALARRYPVLHGWLVPAVHRRKGWTTLHYELTLAGA
jgi:PPOX class probable F420-dependent enzyme